MHLIGGSPQKEIREIENALVQILRSIFMARSFEKITKWNGYRCSPQFWAGTSRSKALAGIPSFVQTKFKQVSLICQKRNIFGEIMMLAPVTRILSCDMNDFKCNHSCQTITLIIIDLFLHWQHSGERSWRFLCREVQAAEKDFTLHRPDHRQWQRFHVFK